MNNIPFHNKSDWSELVSTRRSNVLIHPFSKNSTSKRFKKPILKYLILKVTCLTKWPQFVLVKYYNGLLNMRRFKNTKSGKSLTFYLHGTGNPCHRGRLSTVDLLVLTSLNQLIFNWKYLTFFQKNKLP